MQDVVESLLARRLAKRDEAPVAFLHDTVLSDLLHELVESRNSPGKTFHVRYKTRAGVPVNIGVRRVRVWIYPIDNWVEFIGDPIGDSQVLGDRGLTETFLTLDLQDDTAIRKFFTTFGAQRVHRDGPGRSVPVHQCPPPW